MAIPRASPDGDVEEDAVLGGLRSDAGGAAKPSLGAPMLRCGGTLAGVVLFGPRLISDSTTQGLADAAAKRLGLS